MTDPRRTIQPNAARPHPADPTAAPKRPRRLVLAAGGLAAGLIVLPLLVAHPALAWASGSSTPPAPTSAPSLGGWNVSADGNAVDVLIDNTTGLAGIHPFTEADFPEAQSQFQSGPFASALSTLFWPGNAGGNFGSLSGELGFPSQLSPITSQLNDPARASAQYPAGPQSSTYPAGAPGGVATMQANAEEGGATAESALADESPSTILGFSSAMGTSSATATTHATAQSASNLSDVSLLGGLVDIGSISSTASATSDGSKGSGSAVTHVAGLTVFGQKASIGSDGLVLPSAPGGLGALTGPVVQKAMSQVISGLGLKITEFPATKLASGAGYTVTSGGVSVEIDPPAQAATILEQAGQALAPVFPTQAAIIPTLPGLLQGMTITLTLGRATASADASPAFDQSFTPTPLAPATPTPSAASQVVTTPGTPGTPGSTGSAGASPSMVGTTAGPAATSANGSDSPPGGAGGASGSSLVLPPASLVGLASPLGAGAVLLGVLAALGAGYGLWRLARSLLAADPDSVCPLGQDQP